jgi:hypothetical protein
MYPHTRVPVGPTEFASGKNFPLSTHAEHQPASPCPTQTPLTQRAPRQLVAPRACMRRASSSTSCILSLCTNTNHSCDLRPPMPLLSSRLRSLSRLCRHLPGTRCGVLLSLLYWPPWGPNLQEPHCCYATMRGSELLLASRVGCGSLGR